LEHYVDVDDRLLELREMEEQRRADVVGEVADDAQLRAEHREVELERVDDVQRQLRRGELVGEPRGKVTVDLDGIEVPARSISGRVSAASPGPISTSLSPERGAIASTMRAT
jgi:hypothetical protein